MKLGIFLMLGTVVGLSCWFAGLSPSTKPTTLDQIIREQQRRYVRESYGIWAHQCFTDADLEQFKRDATVHRIASHLKHDRGFIAVVLNIKEMAQDARRKLLESSVKPLHPTWAQLGRITPEGQTEAGQVAEIMIAKGIVDVVEELLDLSVEELRKLS